jgi:flagellar biosynthetic protein FliR
MELAEIFNEANIVAFLLLYFRFAALFIAVPIFSHNNIPMNIKAIMAFFFSVVFYGSVPAVAIPLSVPSIVIAILSEFMLGLVVGVALQIAYNVITFAGGQISFMMGFSMASAIDPQSGISMPIISQFLSLMALMILLSLNLHHWMLLLIAKSLYSVPLGGFLMSQDFFHYIMHAMGHMFVVGFIIAFPVIALSWLADVIFGMLMKTMPQFNLLVIGFPIKIMVSFAVLIATLTALMLILKGEVQNAFNALEMFF